MRGGTLRWLGPFAQDQLFQSPRTAGSRFPPPWHRPQGVTVPATALRPRAASGASDAGALPSSPQLSGFRLSAPRRDHRSYRVFRSFRLTSPRSLSVALFQPPDSAGGRTRCPLKITPAGRPCSADFWSKGRQNETNGRAQKKDHENYRKEKSENRALEPIRTVGH